MAKIIVELCVSTDKSDIDDAVGIINPNHEPIFVSGNIKNNPAIFKDTGVPEILVYIGRRLQSAGKA